MKRKCIWIITLFLLPFISTLSADRPAIDPLGLENKLITSLGVYESAIVVGTGGEGVYYQYANFLPDSDWVNVGLEGKNISAVWPHYVGIGPYEGWGITAGTFPEEGESDYIYCNNNADEWEFFLNSAGISDSLANGVYSVAGFPFTLSICGEKYAATGPALYRQLLADSLWIPVYVELGMEGEGVTHVRTREDIGGLVLAGGSAGHTGRFLVKSTDYGDTWEPISPPGSGSVMAFDFDADSAGEEFQTIFVAQRYEISRSLDGGDTWEIVREDNGCEWFSELVYDPAMGTVFAAGGDCQDTTGAVLVHSSDSGETWERIDLHMSGPIVGLAFGDDKNVYFAIPYRGVFLLGPKSLSTLSDSGQIPHEFRLGIPHPNPFNPSTTIEFSVPRDATVILTILDLLGRQVETILNRQIKAGRHLVEWNASDIPSGVYFVRMTSQDFSQVRKVVKLN